MFKVYICKKVFGYGTMKNALNKIYLLIKLLALRVLGSIAFFIPLAIGLWSIELALYWSGALLILSLIPFLQPITYLGVFAGLSVIWWEFLRAFVIAFLEPHTIFGYLGLGVVFLVTAFILLYSAVFSFGFIPQLQDLLDDNEADSGEFVEETIVEQQPTYAFSPHQVLEVKQDATQEDIRRKYYELMQLYHPDKVQHLGAELQSIAQIKTLEIRRAFDLLCSNG